jgi:hypothetical protein
VRDRQQTALLFVWRLMTVRADVAFWRSVLDDLEGQ